MTQLKNYFLICEDVEIYDLQYLSQAISLQLHNMSYYYILYL